MRSGADDAAAYAPRAHGGLLDAELAALRIDPADVLDASVNVNPYGPCAAVRDAIRDAPIARYPDPTAHAARLAIARFAGVAPSRVVVGGGAVDLLWTIARAWLSPGDAALVVEPAFSELRAAATTAGVRVEAWRAREEDRFAIDLDAVAAAARRARARVVYLASPANPTGVAVPLADVAALARALPDAIVLLDRAFASLAEDDAPHAPELLDRVACLYSMTKEHAIPGVRVGYLIAPPALTARVEACRPPWTVSAHAQAAALAAVASDAFVRESRARLLDDRRRLAMLLADRGVRTLPSATIYLLVPVEPVEDAAATRARLLADHRVLVRDCTSFGLPRHVRVCARPPHDDARLVRALLDRK